jgi:glycosyltransferase involved in cell wall biosynthesis
MSTVCLNMIVKNESHVIRRCLESVRPFIDHWVIVDTGSTDGTQETIREFLREVPGELHERPWKNFGHNRTEALELAREKADYLFVIDADEVLEAVSGFSWPPLVAGGYHIQVSSGPVTYARKALVSNRLKWRYEGVLHEYIICDIPHTQEDIEGIWVRVYHDGGRSQIDPVEKFLRDAHILEEALKTEPDNPRYVFYLAQSYRDSNQPEKALEIYRRRAEMGGWVEEVWYSLYEMARLSEVLRLDSTIIRDRYLQAYQYRPSRAESLGQLARYCREQEQFALAHLFARQGLEIPLSHDLLFRDDSFSQWRCLDEYSIACYWIGEYAESERICRRLLNGGRLPREQVERVLANLNWSLRQQGRPEETLGGNQISQGPKM